MAQRQSPWAAFVIAMATAQPRWSAASSGAAGGRLHRLRRAAKRQGGGIGIEPGRLAPGLRQTRRIAAFVPFISFGGGEVGPEFAGLAALDQHHPVDEAGKLLAIAGRCGVPPPALQAERQIRFPARETPRRRAARPSTRAAHRRLEGSKLGLDRRRLRDAIRRQSELPGTAHRIDDEGARMLLARAEPRDQLQMRLVALETAIAGQILTDAGAIASRFVGSQRPSTSAEATCR